METGPKRQGGGRLKSCIMTLLIAAVFIALFIAYRTYWRVQPGDVVPDMALTSLDGDVVELADFRGRVVILNFFATWCPPCRLELEEMQKKLWPRIKDDNDVVLVTVSRGESVEEVRRFVREKDFEWTFLLDEDGEAFEQVAFSGIPRTLISDRQGFIRYLHLGYERGITSTLLREVEKLKSEKGSDGLGGTSP